MSTRSGTMCFMSMSTPQPTPPSSAAAEAQALFAILDERIAARDREGAVNAALDAVRAGRIGVADLYTQVLSPLMLAIGERWQSGTTRVWEEHYTTQIVRSIVDSLTPDVIAAQREAAEAASRGTERAADRVLMACPPGEQHDLGMRMLADRFRLAGWDVYYLGTDTPVAEIIDAAQRLDVELVVLSASTHFNRVLLRDVASRIRTSLPHARLAVGGPAFALDRHWPAAELLDPQALGLPGSPPTGPSAPRSDETESSGAEGGD